MGLDRPGLLLTASTLIVPATVHGNGDPRSLTLLGLPKTSTSRVRTPHQTEIIYFKLCKSRIPVIEQALETATRMLGSDKSQGFCLELICADFLAGAHLENGDPAILLQAVSRMFDFLHDEQKQQFLERVYQKAS